MPLLSFFAFTDVSPHLIFKNGPHPTLWPQDVPYPGDETDTKNGIAGDGYNDDDSQNGQDGGIHYPAYFKDGKGRPILCPNNNQNLTNFFLFFVSFVLKVRKSYRMFCRTLVSVRLICLSMYVVPFVIRNSNRRPPYCSMVAYISNHVRILVPSAVNVSVNSHI